MIGGSFGGVTYITLLIKHKDGRQFVQVHESNKGTKMVGVIDYHCINYAVYDNIGLVNKSQGGRTISITKGFYQVYAV